MAYIKGAKRLLRQAKNGHVYNYAEGPVPMIDVYEKPVRTTLTGGRFVQSFNAYRQGQKDGANLAFDTYRNGAKPRFPRRLDKREPCERGSCGNALEQTPL